VVQPYSLHPHSEALAAGHRMLLTCAVEGDPAVTELVQSIGAETAWAKITEGVLGEPAAQRAATVPIDAVEGLAKASAMRFVVAGDDEWPSGLDDLRHAESIQRRGGEPLATRTALWLKNWRKDSGDSRFACLKASLRLRYAIDKGFEPGFWAPSDVQEGTPADCSFGGRLKNLGAAVGVNI
jgi:hypothetical protein